MSMIEISLGPGRCKTHSSSIHIADIGRRHPQRKLLFEFVGDPDVILIEKSDPFPFHFLKRQMPGTPKRGLLGRKKTANAVVSVGFYNLRTFVGGAIIPRDKLPIAMGLSDYAVDGFPQVGGAIPDIHDDADKWQIVSPKISVVPARVTFCRAVG